MNFGKLFNEQPKNNIFDIILKQYCIKLTNFRAEGLYTRSPLFDKYITHYLLYDLQRVLKNQMAQMNTSGGQLELRKEMMIICHHSQPVAVIYQSTPQICCLGLIPKCSKLILDTFQAIQENICSDKLNNHLLEQIPNEWGKLGLLSKKALYRNAMIGKKFIRPPISFNYDLIGTSVIGKLNNIDLSKLFKHQIFIHNGIETIKNYFIGNTIRFIFGPVVLHRAELKINEEIIIVYYTQEHTFDTRVIPQNISIILNSDGNIEMCDKTCDYSCTQHDELIEKNTINENILKKTHYKGNSLSINDDIMGCDKIMPVQFNIFAMLWELLNIRDVDDTSLDIFELVFDCSVNEVGHEFIKFNKDTTNEILDRRCQQLRSSDEGIKIFKHNSIDVYRFNGFDNDNEKKTFIAILSKLMKECIFTLKPLKCSNLFKLPIESEKLSTVKNLLLLKRDKHCVYTDNLSLNAAQ